MVKGIKQSSSSIGRHDWNKLFIQGTKSVLRFYYRNQREYKPRDPIMLSELEREIF
jgi:hypothetical protein